MTTTKSLPEIIAHDKAICKKPDVPWKKSLSRTKIAADGAVYDVAKEHAALIVHSVNRAHKYIEAVEAVLNELSFDEDEMPMEVKHALAEARRILGAE